MGSERVVNRPAFGTSCIYDSLAPEFVTYATIKAPAVRKASD